MRYENLVAMTKVAETLKRYKPLSESEKMCVDGSEFLFKGDTPSFSSRTIGHNLTEYNYTNKRYMWTYKIPRTRQENIQNLIYTHQGMGWFEGKIYEKFSLYNPVEYILKNIERYQILPRSKKLRSIVEISTLINLFRRPNLRRIEALSSGTVVEAGSLLKTYGDWFFKYLGNLTSAGWIPPLIIPEFLMNISYVRRDLKRLGIEMKVIQKPVLIQKAMVIRSVRPQLYWTSREVDAFRKAFDINPVQPRASSIIYLSRAGIISNGTKSSKGRKYPNKLVASIVREMGGKVVLTDQTTYDEYEKLGVEAETVVADHGAAMCNIVLWNTKKVIELFTNEWWDDCFLFLSKSLGIEDHILLNIDDAEPSQLRQRLTRLIKNKAI